MATASLLAQRDDETITLVDELSLTVISTTVNGDTTPTRIRRPAAGVVAVLDLTSAASASGDTLDVYLQTRIDAAWVDVVHFTQVLGDGADALRFVAKLSAAEAQTMFEAGASLAAGSVRHIFGDEWRVRYTVVAAGTGTFTFNVWIAPIG